MNPLNITELSLSAKAGICWSFLWRGLLITVGSSVCGGIAGAIVGFILGLAGADAVVPVIAGLLGIAVGVLFIYVWVRWLLSSRLGQFRLMLVRAEEAAQPCGEGGAAR